MKKLLISMIAALAVCLSGCSKEASSIGIIGGADGPTAVFVTAKPNFPIMIPVIAAAAIVVGFIVWLITRHK